MTTKENLLRAIRHDAPDHVPYYGEGGLQYVSYRGALPPDNGDDLWGVGWRKRVDEALPYPVDHPVQTLAQLAALPFPDPGDSTLFADMPAVMDHEHCLVVGCHYTALFERLYCLCGMENALVWMAEQAETVRAFLMRLAEWHVEIARSFVGLGVEAGRLSDDYGAQRSLLMSPALWRSTVRPALALVVDYYRSTGRLVFLHSCGCLASILDDLVALGIDVFNIQTSANDLAAFKKRYGGRVTLMGGIDTQQVMARGSPELVKTRVAQAIQALGSGGGLILEPDQRVRMPEENLQAFLQAARKHGSYAARLPRRP